MDDVEILLVEDNPADVELTLRALKKNSIANRVQVAEDGEVVLNFLFGHGEFSSRNTDNKPKVVLLDLNLPKVDGLEVLRTIKSNPKTQAIPVVVLTTSKQETDIIESYRLGANSYIVKPVDFEKFVDSVRELGMYWLSINQPPL
ncbi:MAG: response regulator [Bacteroidales bacterium]|jgi:CheY-like chemotaxis protein|nr:response regulator [Bacteroidales bacterium]